MLDGAGFCRLGRVQSGVIGLIALFVDGAVTAGIPGKLVLNGRARGLLASAEAAWIHWDLPLAGQRGRIGYCETGTIWNGECCAGR